MMEILDMRKELLKADLYVTPMMEFLECESEGVLCSSFEIFDEEDLL